MKDNTMNESLKEMAQTWMTDEQFEVFQKTNKEQLLDRYIGSKEGSNPPWIVAQMVGRNDPTLRHETLCIVDNSKVNMSIAATELGRNLAKTKEHSAMFPAAAILTAEAWMLVPKDKDYRPKGSLADEPDREECVIVVTMTVELGRRSFSMYKVKRNKKGIVTKLIPATAPTMAYNVHEDNVLPMFFHSYLLEVYNKTSN